jgi:hypothetical protein
MQRTHKNYIKNLETNLSMSKLQMHIAVVNKETPHAGLRFKTS